MATKTLSAIRAICRQFLRDEAFTAYKWEDDELDLHIADCLAEISERRPYEVKEELTTEASKELGIGDIEDLLEVDKAEFPVGSDPPDYRNVSVFGNTLTIDIDSKPSAGQTVYLYCHKLHQLTESTSTLSPQLERMLVLGVTAQAAISKAQSHINRVNVGGGRTPAEMQAWGTGRLALYRSDLKRLAKPRTYRTYPKS